MKVKLFVRSVIALIVVFALVLFPAPHEALAKTPQITFELGTPGVSLEPPDTLLVAVQIINTGSKTAYGVRIDSIQLESAVLLTSTPILVGQIDAGEGAIIQANFNSHLLTPENHYRLGIHGHYETMPVSQDDGKNDDKSKDGGKNNDKSSGNGLTFSLKAPVVLPPASPGSGIANTGLISPQQVSGAPFPPQPPNFEEDEANPEGSPVPTASFVPGTPTLTNTGVQAIPAENMVWEQVAPPVVISTNNSLGLNANTCCAEPSGASGGGVVFMTANSFAAYSTDGGNTFTQLDPTTIFPNTDDGGFCCDQIVQYVDDIDRFIWLMQLWRGPGGTNRIRIASASPADIINSNGTAWTYWDLTSGFFGLTGWLDYPDLSVGTHFLYMSVDEVGVGLLVARLPLDQIQASGTVFVEWTNPTLSSMAYFSHLTQNTRDEIFWAGHNNNRQMRVFSWHESTNVYFWRDINISSWANSGLSSITPDGQDWLTAARNNNFFAPIGSTRVGNQIWFAWNAGTDNNFPQPHIEIVTLDRNDDFHRLAQVQIWNPDYAFAYPALATNYCTGEVGLSFEFGGGGNYENHVVGFWGDFVAYITSGSNAGANRFGDYVTIRRAPPTQLDPGNLFTAFGYGLNTVPPPGVGINTDIHYVLFGRPSSWCQIGI